jgi:hypothetical protein
MRSPMERTGIANAALESNSPTAAEFKAACKAAPEHALRAVLSEFNLHRGWCLCHGADRVRDYEHVLAVHQGQERCA